MNHRVIVLGLFASVLLSIPLGAHHAVQAQFDFDRPIEFKGTLSKVEWINPHSYLHLDVKNQAGEVVTWAFETVGLNGLRQNGLRSASAGVKIGETYVFKGLRARNGRPVAFLQEVTFPDSRKLLVWAGDPNAN